MMRTSIGLCYCHRLVLLLACLAILLQASAYKPISDDTLRKLPRPGDDFDIHHGKLLSPILRTRVPGTPGSTAVLNHFNDFFRTTLPDWTIEFQNSTSTTPATGDKQIPFVNFIASRDPPWAPKGDVGRLTLVAHYDSKREPEGFIGAIDSAAPCAMIMHAVRSIDAALTRKWADMEATGTIDADLDGYTGIQVLFLDGEEAFLKWSATDSLYGARSLSETWAHAPNPPLSIFKTRLSSITLFVLLDLLGAKDPSVGSYFPTTHWAYQNMAKLEQRFRENGLFKSSPDADSRWFVHGDLSERDVRGYGSIQDDHIPFLQRGVEVLHIIDTPGMTGFPKVWHTLDDDGEHLDLPTVEDWSMLVTAFVAEWMELDGYFDENTSSRRNEALKNGLEPRGVRVSSWKTEL
ncbi:hypothetical protein VTN31DRAFT_4546 [Thermomyces dupontii]|uniref:uncharacterized protein n=1 Tax=Talaromyces thermophilus TaxID=28565 RepID=UPI0037423F79